MWQTHTPLASTGNLPLTISIIDDFSSCCIWWLNTHMCLCLKVKKVVKRKKELMHFWISINYFIYIKCIHFPNRQQIHFLKVFSREKSVQLMDFLFCIYFSHLSFVTFWPQLNPPYPGLLNLISTHSPISFPLSVSTDVSWNESKLMNIITAS